MNFDLLKSRLRKIGSHLLQFAYGLLLWFLGNLPPISFGYLMPCEADDIACGILWVTPMLGCFFITNFFIFLFSTNELLVKQNYAKGAGVLLPIVLTFLLLITVSIASSF